MRKVYLQGGLRKLLPKGHDFIELDVKTVNEAVRHLKAVCPGFIKIWNKADYFAETLNLKGEELFEYDFVGTSPIWLKPCARFKGGGKAAVQTVPESEEIDKRESNVFDAGKVSINLLEGNPIPVMYGDCYGIGKKELLLVSAGLYVEQMRTAETTPVFEEVFVDGFLGESLSFDGGGKGGGSQSLSQKEDPNTLQSNSVVKLLFAVSHGEMEAVLADGLKSLYFNGVPVVNSDDTQNFTGVIVETRNGLPDQSYIKGNDAVRTLVNIGSLVTKSTPVQQSISNTSADAVNIVVELNRLTLLDDEGLHGNIVQLRIDTKVDDQPWINGNTKTITGKTTSRYQRQYRIDKPLGATGDWLYRVVRITEDFDDDSTQTGNLTLSSHTEIQEAKLNYPNIALLYIEIDAGLFGGSYPEITIDSKGIKTKIPVNLDPETGVHSGLWNGQFKRACTNLAPWHIYDLATNETYGLGTFINTDNVYKESLYQASVRCTGQVINQLGGGMQQRHQCGVYLTKPQSPFVVLRNLASTFRGSLYWGKDSLRVETDMPKDPTVQVTKANAKKTGKGNFKYSTKRQREIYNQVYVKYLDVNGKEQVVSYRDEEGIKKHGRKSKNITAYGCYRREEAFRQGKWFIETQTTELINLTYTQGLEGFDYEPGEIAEISDPKIMGQRLGGRIVSIDGAAITLDSQPTINITHNYILSIEIGRDIVRRNVIAQNGKVLMVDTAYPGDIDSGMVWALKSDTVRPLLFKIIGVSGGDKFQYAIKLKQFDPNKFSRIEENEIIDAEPYSLIPDGIIPAPSEVNLEQYLYNDGVVTKSGLEISLPPSPDPRATKYIFELNRPDEKGYQRLGDIRVPNYTLTNLPRGEYQARVAVANESGSLVSAYSESNIYTLTGKNSIALAPMNLSLTVVKGIGVVIKVDPVNEHDLSDYNYYANGALIAEKVKSPEYVWKDPTVNTHTIAVAWNDTVGNTSPRIEGAVVIREDIAPTSLTDTLAEITEGNALSLQHAIDQLTQDINLIQLKADEVANQAAIARVIERTVTVENDSQAQASTLTQLTASLNTATQSVSQITEDLNTLSTSQSSSAESITLLQSQLQSANDAISGINETLTTLSTEDEALAETQRSQLAQITFNEQLLSDNAIATLNNGLDEIIGNTERSNQAVYLETVNTNVTEVDARTRVVEQLQSTLDNEIGTQSASIENILETYANINGELVAKGATLLDVDGRVSGTVSTNDGASSSFTFIQDLVKIVKLVDGVEKNVLSVNSDTNNMEFEGTIRAARFVGGAAFFLGDVMLLLNATPFGDNFIIAVAPIMLDSSGNIDVSLISARNVIWGVTVNGEVISAPARQIEDNIADFTVMSNPVGLIGRFTGNGFGGTATVTLTSNLLVQWTYAEISSNLSHSSGSITTGSTTGTVATLSAYVADPETSDTSTYVASTTATYDITATYEGASITKRVKVIANNFDFSDFDFDFGNLTLNF